MTDNNKAYVEIYTDGACSGNPGKGGFGVVLRYKKINNEIVQKEISQGYKLTTNNRMELLACIKALEVLKRPCRIMLTSDSRYVVDAVEKKWINNWVAKNFLNNSKQKIKNKDLWLKLFELMKPHDIKFVWIKGHAGHEFNEICDRLAVCAYNSSNLKTDEGYESTISD